MRPAAQARALIEAGYRELFGATPSWPVARLLMAQSRGEGRWGELGGVDALGDPYGENWGAVQDEQGPPCRPGTFEHGDSKPTTSGQVPFRWCFIGYSPDDPEGPRKGVRDFLRHALVYRKSAHQALHTGDPRAYATALYGDGSAPYFGGFGATVPERIQSYVTFLENHAAAVDHELGLPPPKLRKPAPATRPKRGGGLLPLALGAAWLLIKR